MASDVQDVAKRYKRFENDVIIVPEKQFVTTKKGDMNVRLVQQRRYYHPKS